MISNWTILYIQRIKTFAWNEIFSLCIGETTAAKRTDFINCTSIVLVQEMTGWFPVHDISGRILPQILVTVFLWGHSNMLSDAVNVGTVVCWSHDFAAIGTLPTVNFLVCFLVKAIYCWCDSFRFSIGEPMKKAYIFFRIFFNFPLKCLQRLIHVMILKWWIIETRIKKVTSQNMQIVQTLARCW